MHHRAPPVEAMRMWRRLDLTGYRSLEVPGPGAVAHMSLHQKPTMSKSHPTCRSGQQSIPDLHRGTGHPFCVGDRYEQSRKIRQRRVGEGPYMEGVGFGQPPFCNFVAQSLKSSEIRHLWPAQRRRLPRWMRIRRARGQPRARTCPAGWVRPRPYEASSHDCPCRPAGWTNRF